MIKEIQLKESRDRIDYLLGCLSGITPNPAPKISLLDSLYKEIVGKYNPTEEEKKHILYLFEVANKKENMSYRIADWSREKIYFHKELHLNDIELYLRSLLARYKHYSIKQEKVDYQLGER